MASVTTAASFLATSPVSTQATSHRRLVISNSIKTNTAQVNSEESNSNNGRREVVFAAISATLCSAAGIALADGPKRGTPEAKKAYGPVCVANPTARICNN